MKGTSFVWACALAWAGAVAVGAQSPAQGPPSNPPVGPAVPAAPQPQTPQAPVPAGVRQAGRPADGAPMLTEYRIGPEDVIDVLVWKNPELTRTVTVRPDGRISLPLVNDVAASGLTPSQLRQILTEGLAPYVNEAEVSVVVREIHSMRVSVIGMVKTPGRFDVASQITVLEALALAGGLTEFAKKDRIAILRYDGRRWQRYGFDYTNALYENAEQNVPLRAGDIVVVP